MHESSPRPASSTSEPAVEEAQKRCAAKGCRKTSGSVRSNTPALLAPFCVHHRHAAHDLARRRGGDLQVAVAEMTGAPRAPAVEPSPRSERCKARGCDQEGAGVRADTKPWAVGLCSRHRKLVGDIARQRDLDGLFVAGVVHTHGDEARAHLDPPTPTTAEAPAPTPVATPVPVPSPVPAPAPLPAPPPTRAGAISREMKLAFAFTLPPGCDADRALACAERAGTVEALEVLLDRIEALGGIERTEAVLARVAALGGIDRIEARAQLLQQLHELAGGAR